MKRDVFRRGGLAGAIAVFILLGAVVPNVLYLGHTDAPVAHSHARQLPGLPQAPAGEEHALHCHSGPAGCAGAQAMVGSVWAGEDHGLLAPAAETQRLPADNQITTLEAPVIRHLEPPRFA